MILAQQDNGTLFEFTLEPLSQEYGIPLAIMGVMVVFLALSLVVTFITVLPRALAVFSREEEQAAEAEQVLGMGEDELPESVLVVIAAAVAHAIDRPQRIVRIRGLTPTDLGWSLEGRTQQHQSHRIQNRAGR